MSKLIAVDFDGVIHSYTSRWVNETHIPDPPVPGAIEFLTDLIDKGFKVAIFSTRNSSPFAIDAMKFYLQANGLEFHHVEAIQFPIQKPTLASLFIDDRGFHFRGEFPTLEYCANFKPWNRQP